MSQLFVDNIESRTGGPIGIPTGAVVTGVITATSFSGDGSGLTGVASTDNIITSGIVTITNATDSTSSTTGALKVTGGIGVGLSMTVGGNLSVGGTLTYEDVTNIDSVGLVTARAGVVIVGGGLTVTGITTFKGNLLPEANGTRDLGATGTRWANLYTSDIDLSNEAKGGNEIDGTWGSYTIQEGENDLFLINRRNGKKYKFVLQEVS